MDGNLTSKKLADELGKLTRRIDSIEKNVDMLSNDERNILENINARLAAIEEAINITRQHDDTVRKDLKEEINKVEFTVGEKVDEIKNKMDTKTMIAVKSKSIFHKILDSLVGKG